MLWLSAEVNSRFTMMNSVLSEEGEANSKTDHDPTRHKQRRVRDRITKYAVGDSLSRRIGARGKPFPWNAVILRRVWIPNGSRGAVTRSIACYAKFSRRAGLVWIDRRTRLRCWIVAFEPWIAKALLTLRIEDSVLRACCCVAEPTKTSVATRKSGVHLIADPFSC